MFGTVVTVASIRSFLQGVSQHKDVALGPLMLACNGALIAKSAIDVITWINPVRAGDEKTTEITNLQHSLMLVAFSCRSGYGAGGCRHQWDHQPRHLLQVAAGDLVGGPKKWWWHPLLGQLLEPLAEFS